MGGFKSELLSTVIVFKLDSNMKMLRMLAGLNVHLHITRENIFSCFDIIK